MLRERIKTTLANYINHGWNSGLDINKYKSRTVPAIIQGIENDPDIKKLREQSLKKDIETRHSDDVLLEEIEYAKTEFGLDPNKNGWLRKSLTSHLKNMLEKEDNSSGVKHTLSKLECAITLGQNYDLLSKKEIKGIEEKIRLRKLCQRKDNED